MFHDRTLERLNQMLDLALSGEFQESDYDESKLSRLECKWKQFLATSQLSYDKLDETKKNIESFVSDISHQTKTPIANIRLYIELLEERLQQPEELALITEIHRQADKLDFLIQSLTKLSRLENNIIEVHPQPDSVHRLVDELLEGAAQKAAGKEIVLVDKREEALQVKEDGDGEPGGDKLGQDCTVWVDRKWTMEALANILDNAIKYSPAGSRIEVSVIEYQLYVAISIRDYGIGISEEEQPKIFERFYRSQEVAGEEGVGLGLHLAREIIQRENGYIRVRSQKGQGCEFQVFLWRK